MKVAIVGLGRMGTAISERLVDGGHDVAVHNRTPGRAGDLVARGAREVVDRAALWGHADVCITMVSDSEALEATALGPAGLAELEAGRGKLLIDMSTVAADASARVAEVADSHGIAFLRAPVSGNPAVVRAGGLGIIVSGEPAAFAAAEPLLRDIGPNVFYLGEGERARVMKLALNLMVAGTAELLAECVTLGEAHGLDRAAMLEVVSGSAVGSPFVKYKTDALVANDYRSTFTTELMRKDLDLALASAHEGRVPLPATATVRALLDMTIEAGFGHLDFMALLLRLKREAGADVAELVGRQ
jgi:3-hydroxyisobutyrate dehydrogenase-like beta-hydroxyacid dehydrogenase